eukprot:UN02181
MICNNVINNNECWISFYNNFLIYLTCDELLLPFVQGWAAIPTHFMTESIPILKNVMKEDVEILYRCINNNNNNNNNMMNNNVVPILTSLTKLKIIQWFNNLNDLCIKYEKENNNNNNNDAHNKTNVNRHYQQQQQSLLSKEQIEKICDSFNKEIKDKDNNNILIEISLFPLQSYHLHQHVFIDKDSHNNNNNNDNTLLFDLNIEREVVIEAFKLNQKQQPPPPQQQQQDGKSSVTSSLSNIIDDIQLSYILYYCQIHNSYDNTNKAEFKSLVNSIIRHHHQSSQQQGNE